MDTLLADSADRLFAGLCNEAAAHGIENGGSANALWEQIEDSGFADVLLPEERGGAGLALPDAYPLMYAAGRHALPVPYAHTLLARAWLHAAGAEVPAGSIAIAGHGLHAEGMNATAQAQAFGRAAQWLLAQMDGRTLLLPLGTAERNPTESGPAWRGPTERGPAASRDSLDAELHWQALPADADAGCTQDPGCGLDTLCAAGTAALLAGAADRVLELTLAYANQRKQFGKPIGRFQAVQNQIAVMAERAWAARMAAQMACRSADWRPGAVPAAIGKGVASEAAAIIADIGHAVHGAIGITREYELQRYTRRLREWRLAGGSETFWYRSVGAALLQTQDSALSFLCATLAAAPDQRT